MFFWIFAIIAIGLLITSFILPPTGEINPSVLQASGELFLFASLGAVIKAIDRGTSATLKHRDTEITIEKKDE